MQKLFLLILFILFTTNNLFAGLGNTNWGTWGIKRDIEVNEIEVIEAEEKKDENDNKFKVIELKDIDINTVGTISEDEGGLGYDMWAGSKRNLIETYLKSVPINKESDLAIKLIKKILLTSANVPGKKDEIDLILVRIDKLIKLGDFDNAKKLIDAITNKSNEEILIKQSEINLSLNNFDLVCADIIEKRTEFKENIFWRKVEIFCQVLNNEINKANLSLTLLKENTNFEDENFLKILDSLIYKEEINGDNFDNLNLLNLAMTRIANINLKEGYILKEDPLLLSMIYRMPNVPTKLRIEAIEKSKKLLNLPIETIEEIYNSYDVNEKDKKISLDDEILLGYETQAILYQMAIKENNDEKKAKIIKKSLEFALINGNFNLISKLNLNSLLEIEPSKTLAWFASYASKALLVSEKMDEAIQWFEVLEKQKDKNIDFFNDFVELWTIIEFFNLKNGPTDYKKIPQNEIVKLVDTYQSEEKAINFDTLGFYMLEFFGIEINPIFWLVSLETQKMESKILPNSSLMSLLEYSAENKRVGETILLILKSLDGKNFNEFHPFFLQIAISSLNQIGLRENAFDLAIETLIDR